MSGFADLLAVIAAMNKEGEKTPAIMSRISASTPDAEPVTDALSIRRSNAATAVGDQIGEAPLLTRILGQMRAVNAEVLEAASTIESLSIRADEVAAEVEFKISKGLASILDPGSGGGVSGHFDKDTGQFLGGALSNERKRELVDLFNELLDVQSTKLNAFQQFYVNESLKKTAEQFRREFGTKDSIKSLAQQLRDYLAAAAKQERAGGATSGTLGRAPTPSAASTSIAVLRWSGGLR